MAEPKENGVKSKPGEYQSLENLAETTTTKFLQSDTLCGCGPCKPTFVQRLSNPIVFTLHAGLLMAMYICAIIYFNGIITTIERAFQISSSEVAVLAVLNDASSLCLILFVTYFGHKSHRPRWIATGAIIIAVGFVFCTLPHFLTDPIDPQSLVARGSSTEQSSSPKQILQSLGVCGTTFKSTGNQSHDLYDNSTTIDECEEESPDDGLGPIKWLVIGQIIIGCGGAPLFPFILSYIDDAVKKHQFTSYTAFLFVSAMIGPIFGFLLTSAATSRYVDFDRIPADEIPDLEQYDPRWIGAWWLGFPLFSVLLIIFAIPMFFYPKVMRPKPTETHAEDDHKEDDKSDDIASIAMTTKGIFADTSGGIIEAVKGLFLAIKRLIFNAALMLLCLGASAETAMGAIFSTFRVKYFQTQFQTSPSTAALLMGGIIVPCVGIAQVVSAVICRRYKLNTKQCAILIVGCHVFAFLFTIAQLFIGCENTPVAGISTPYWTGNAYSTSQPDGVSMSSRYRPIEMSTHESACNTNCGCPDEIFSPVCGADGVSYISPCHAGCKDFNSSGLMRYGKCSCISARNSSFGDDIDDTAVPGLCWESCDANTQLTVLMALTAIVAFAESLTYNPQMFVIFRLVEEDDRSIAIGIQSVITKCLAFFPAPITMGMIINSTCTLWQYTCGDRGSCWLYDVMAYRYLFIGVLIGLKCLSVIFYGAVVLAIKPSKEEDNIEQKEMKDTNANSAVI